MNFHPRTLRGRLTLWYSAILTVSLFVLAATSTLLIDRGLRKTVDDSLMTLARTIADSVEERPSAKESLDSLLELDLAERFFQLLDPFGELDHRFTPPHKSRLPFSATARRHAERGEATYETLSPPTPASKPIRLLTLPVVRNGTTVNIVQTAMSLENVEAARAHFLLILFALTPLVLATAALGGWFLARRALAPVDAIITAAQRIQGEDLSARLPARSRDAELARLTEVLNDMLERIEAAFAVVRRFSADAAHELKTPLTILKGEIEVALGSTLSTVAARQTLQSCLEEVNRLSSLIEDLLLMARIDGNAWSAAAKPVNLAEVMADVEPALTELAARAGNRCTVQPADPLWVNGSEPLLFRLVFNLADNAIKYTPANGSIEVSLRSIDGSALWEVKDNGPGIPVDAQARLFERFYRGDPAREGTGTGLGLALVRSIVQLHHGRIELTSALGKGSNFRVILPRIPAPDLPVAVD